MDLKQFGEQLQALRKQARLSQERLVDALDQHARTGPAEEYRVIDGTLISRWERARTQASRQWKPTRAYVLHLIHIFAKHLNLETAQQWAAQAGYPISALELAQYFAPVRSIPVRVAGTAGSTEQAASLATPRHNLPTALTSFIGRTDEISTLVKSLTTATTRLVTIVGEGGVGKTRLALAAAQALLEEGAIAPDYCPFPDGIWFVPLVGLEGAASGHANQLASAIAKALGFSFSHPTLEPVAQLNEVLYAKTLLLILDNFEHLTAGTPFVLDLLQQAPQVRILITSRVPLNCQAERRLTLQGLPVPIADGQAAFAFPSIQLFTERVRQQTARFILDGQTVQDVAHLCQLVDGNPLGMELAAPWVQHYTVAEIVAALQQQDHSLLATDQHDVPLRHRSMEVVFETSWQLLSPNIQRILAQLSVFRGAFSRAAVLAVTNATLTELVELVNSSLLHTVQESSGCRSYLLHELVRQFATAKLAALEVTQPGLVLAIYQRHSDYYLHFLAERTHALYGHQMNLIVAEVQETIDNVRAAWQWAVTYRTVDVLAHTWLGLSAFYHVHSLYQEGETVFRKAAAALSTFEIQSPQAATLLAELQIAQAFFLNLLHRYAEAKGLVCTVLATRPCQEVSPVVARAQLEWGIALSFQSQYDEALPQLATAVQLARRLALPVVEARAQHALFRVMLPKGEVAQAIAVLEQALSLYQQAGYRLAEGFVLRSLGYVAQLQSKYDRALFYWEQALAIYQAVEDQPRLISLWQHLGDAHEAVGDLGRAYHDYLAAYNQRNEVQDPRSTAHTLEGFARLLASLGEYSQARQYSQAALVEQRRLGDLAGMIQTLCTLGWVHQQVGEAATALMHYCEALQLIRASSTFIYEGVALLGIGQAQAALGEIEAAMASYHQALLRQRQVNLPPWVVETLSELAHLNLDQARLTDALALVNEIMAVLAAATLQGAREPFRVYWICYQVLQANHDPRAVSLLAATYQRLQAQAITLDHESLRHSFLNQIAVNRAIRAAYLVLAP